MDDFWKIVTIFLFGALVVLIVTHATGFSKAAGTIFSGFGGWGQTLTGAAIKGGT